MSAPRFFIDPATATLAPRVELPLPDAVSRHAVQVLRLRDGDAVTLFDGRGGEYAATLRVQSRAASVDVGAHADVEREARHPVTLVQSIVAPDVMDWIVRKAVELGAGAIAPVVSSRTQRAPAERLDRRLERWRQIAVAACEQCGRNRVPPVHAPAALDDWMRAQPSLSAAVLLDPSARASLAESTRMATVRMVLVGPEGGLVAEEVAAARAAGIATAHLGVRILRAETAALAALATLEAVDGFSTA
jgi:16S rRNA (uracil1498-N3)-methyltransferase